MNRVAEQPSVRSGPSRGEPCVRFDFKSATCSLSCNAHPTARLLAVGWPRLRTRPRWRRVALRAESHVPSTRVAIRAVCMRQSGGPRPLFMHVFANRPSASPLRVASPLCSEPSRLATASSHLARLRLVCMSLAPWAAKESALMYRTSHAQTCERPAPCVHVDDWCMCARGGQRTTLATCCNVLLRYEATLSNARRTPQGERPGSVGPGCMLQRLPQTVRDAIRDVTHLP
jgi:hypothetical protein